MTASEETLLRVAASANELFRIDVASRQDPQSVRFYLLQGALSADDLEKLSRELLADPVTEVATLYQIDPDGRIVQTYNQPNITTDETAHALDIALLPGVTDTTAESMIRAARQIGIRLNGAATGRRYHLAGDLTHAQIEALAQDRYYNPVIQRISIDAPIAPAFVPTSGADRTVDVIAVRGADDAGLLAISQERRLALDLNEMKAIRDYYTSEDRDPTDVEIEMIAQTWSEHCVHKTFRALIDYTGPAHGAPADSEPVEQQIDGLLKTYIRAATDKVNRDFVRSAFVDNAGIIAFDDQFDLAFKVETHNHPSALEPFGGANTGVGGVVRDILGVSARPIANTDVLCFGYPDTPADKIPAGVLHPERIAEGVIHGIEDYGNKMGIPTVNGAIHYHEGYTANPLVFCGCLGILPRDSHRTSVRDGDLIVVLGGRTGRDGLRGATFSSMEMDTTTSQVAGSAVQIGNPIMEKQVQEVILRLRDAGLYHAITDCGAGGLSSAVGEMASGVGATVKLETVPLKYPGLRPWEIWLSEAQERMVIAVDPADWEAVAAISAGQNVEAVAIGAFEASGRLVLLYEDTTVGEISVEFLHDGIPRRHLKAEWKPKANRQDAEDAKIVDVHQHLLDLLASPTIRSKEDVIRRYDHEVQGGTAVKPLGGVGDHAPNDGAVLVPLDTLPGGKKGVALSVGICPQYTDADPYAMAWAAVDEAMRNLVAVGADPDQVAILDNFCWGDPRKPDRLGSLVRCAQGCYDAALAYNVPFISGKDSLNNEYTDVDGSRHAIPGTLLISAVGIVPDVSKTVTSNLRQDVSASNYLYLVGTTHNQKDAPQPTPDALNIFRALHWAIQAGIVRACHDLSEGGLAVALAEMCIGGRVGASVDLSQVVVGGSMGDTEILFNESGSRFLVEVYSRPTTAESFELAMNGLPFARIGQVSWSGTKNVRRTLSIKSIDTHRIVGSSYSWDVASLERAWRGVSTASDSETVPTQSSVLSTQSSSPHRTPTSRTTPPRALILHANGSNRDRDAAMAIKLAGGESDIVHMNQLASGEKRFDDYQMLIVPGGFSYGDDLGAGVLWSLDLREQFKGELRAFVDAGKPVMGICNGFQALVKAGILPGSDFVGTTPALSVTDATNRPVTLTYNERGHFECRWVTLIPNLTSPCLFTEGFEQPITCPVAHGEGRIAVADQQTLDALVSRNLIALTYGGDGYPANPNGSVMNIAGLTNRAGNVLGLMPHPEDHIFDWQNPTHRSNGTDGLRLFKNMVKYA